MALTLCSTCRLPVNEAADRCPLCTAPMEATPGASRHVPVAAAALAAVVATVALLTRRIAA